MGGGSVQMLRCVQVCEALKRHALPRGPRGRGARRAQSRWRPTTNGGGRILHAMTYLTYDTAPTQLFLSLFSVNLSVVSCFIYCLSFHYAEQYFFPVS